MGPEIITAICLAVLERLVWAAAGVVLGVWLDCRYDVYNRAINWLRRHGRWTGLGRR